MHEAPPFAAWARERQARIEGVLDRALPAPTGPHERLHAAMRHATLEGGKRMRPLLAYAAGELTGASAEAVDPAAAAVELIHAYSLVHDDLPCMDDDDLRRGKPTCHVAFGEAMALLAGDALQSLAFATLARGMLREAGPACALLGEAAGHAGMAGGQAVDLAATGTTQTEAALAAMHRQKTGALIGAAVRLGAMCGRPLQPREEAALVAFVQAAGLAFQVADDVLDVEGASALLGKTAGKDAAQGKATFVTLLGVADAKARMSALRADAHAALQSFGAAAGRLHELADWIVLRSN